MSDAVYSLLGALGGAVVAGSAAFWGPLQLQKRARREAEAQRDQAQAEAASMERAQLMRAQIARVVLVRRSIGAWAELLERTMNAIAAGRVVDVDEFHQAANHAKNEASTAVYEALNDGLYIPARRGSHDFQDGVLGLEDYMHDPGPGEAEPFMPGSILDVFEVATGGVSVVVTRAATGDSGAGRPPWEDLVRATWHGVHIAGWNRAELSKGLMRHVESIADITTIEVRGTRESGAEK